MSDWVDVPFCDKCHYAIMTVPRADDIGTKWYRCGNCGEETSTPKIRKVDIRKVGDRVIGDDEVPPVCHEEPEPPDPKLTSIEQVGTLGISYSECCVSDINKWVGYQPQKMAYLIYKTERFKTDVETGMLYYYDGKSWIPKAEPYLERLLGNILVAFNDREDLKLPPLCINTVLSVLKALTYTEIRFGNKIACLNGLLDPETGVLSPFTPDEMPFYQIPVAFDPAAKCPNWESFIAQIMPDDDDALLLQEASGYILLPDLRFHKIFWLHGLGRNGKGVWQRTMESILGLHNVSNLGLEEFDGEHRFALANLYGKLVNFSSEPSTKKALQTNILKKVSGEDTMDGEIKGLQKRLNFRSCATPFVIGNQFPKVYDRTVAFKERRVFIPFKVSFTGRDVVPHIEDRWLRTNDERSGILNWMLAGVKRILTQGGFTESKSQLEIETEFLRASDSVSAWMLEYCTFGGDSTTSRAKTLEHYLDYCERNGLPTVSSKALVKRLTETPKMSVVKTHGGIMHWKGLALKPLPEEEKDGVDGADGVGKDTETKSLQSKLSNNNATPSTPRAPLYCYKDCVIYDQPACDKLDAYRNLPDPKTFEVPFGRRCGYTPVSLLNGSTVA